MEQKILKFRIGHIIPSLLVFIRIYLLWPHPILAFYCYMDQELLTRKELYDLAWSTPLTTLAKKYGLSDNGLRKICKKLNIPLPKNGHWMKLQFNKKVEIIPLPSSDEEVTVTFSLKDMADADAKKKLVKEIREKICALAVPQRLSSPDPLIVQAKQQLLERDSRRSLGSNDMVRSFRDGLDITVTVKNVNRALCFMDALIKALYKRGHQIILKNGFTYVRVRKQELRIVFREKTKRVVIAGKSWNSSEYHPTGILYFKYDRWGTKEWKDGRKALEEYLPDILARLESASAELTAIQEEHQRRWDEIKRKEQEEKILWEHKQKELADFKELLKKAERWQKVNTLRGYIDAMDNYAKQNGICDDIQQWLNWSRKKADWYDPFLEEEDELLEGANRTALSFSDEE